MTTKTFKTLVNNEYYAHLQVDIKQKEGGKLEVYVSSPSIPLYRISIRWRVVDWYSVTAQELLDDIEMSTRKSPPGYLCFGTMYQEVCSLKVRDHFGIPSDRTLTSAWQFPLKRGDVSRQYPHGWEIYTCPTSGKKKKVDRMAA